MQQISFVGSKTQSLPMAEKLKLTMNCTEEQMRLRPKVGKIPIIVGKHINKNSKDWIIVESPT